MINAQRLEGQWNEVKGALKKHWGTLTQDDLRTFNGNVDQLVGLIQRKTGESRDAIQQYLEELTTDASSFVSSAADMARDYVQQAGDSARDAYEKVTDQVRDGYSNAEAIVRNRPGESVAFAFGAGIFAGLILGLVMHKK